MRTCNDCYLLTRCDTASFARIFQFADPECVSDNGPMSLGERFASNSVHCREIGFLKVWIIAQDFILGHTGCKHVQHVPDSDPEAADARLPGALTRYNSDAGKVGSVGGGHKPIIPRHWPGNTVPNHCFASEKSAGVKSWPA